MLILTGYQFPTNPSKSLTLNWENSCIGRICSIVAHWKIDHPSDLSPIVSHVTWSDCQPWPTAKATVPSKTQPPVIKSFISSIIVLILVCYSVNLKFTVSSQYLPINTKLIADVSINIVCRYSQVCSTLKRDVYGRSEGPCAWGS